MRVNEPVFMIAERRRILGATTETAAQPRGVIGPELHQGSARRVSFPLTLPAMPPNRLPLGEAALRAKRTYHQLLALVQRGEIVGGREGVRWWVDERSLELYIANTSAAAPEALTVSAEDDARATALLESTPQIAQLSILFAAYSIQREAILVQLEADAREARQQGRDDAAEALQLFAEGLATSSYMWDAERSAWRIEIPGIGTTWTKVGPSGPLASPRGIPA